jgi:hypothetical protein
VCAGSEQSVRVESPLGNAFQVRLDVLRELDEVVQTLVENPVEASHVYGEVAVDKDVAKACDSPKL